MLPNHTTEYINEPDQKTFNLEANVNHRLKRFYFAKFTPAKILTEISETTDGSTQTGIFDFGELTRVVTLTIFLNLCHEKHVSLSSYIGEYVNHFSCWGKETIQLWELLSGSKILARFSPTHYLENLDLRLRPGLLRSRIGKKSVLFEVCRLNIEREKSGTDQLNFLILEHICDILSCSTLDKLTAKLTELSGCTGGFGFIDFSRVSKFARDSLNTEFIQDLLDRKYPPALIDCVSLGGITGFYGLVGKPSAFVMFLQKFLANLENSGPLVPDPILRISRAYLPENQIFFLRQVDRFFAYTDSVGNTFAFDLSLQEPVGAIFLVDLSSQPTKEEAKTIQRLVLSHLQDLQSRI